MRDGNDLRENEAQKRYGRSFRELGERDRNRIDEIIVLEQKSTTRRDPVDPKTGLSPEQVMRIASVLCSAIDEQLPELVRSHLTSALHEIVKPMIAKAVAESEGGVATSLESALAAAEAATTAIGRASGGERLEERLRALENSPTIASHEHRLDRHSDHLAKIETRLKRLENQQ